VQWGWLDDRQDGEGEIVVEIAVEIILEIVVEIVKDAEIHLQWPVCFGRVDEFKKRLVT